MPFVTIQTGAALSEQAKRELAAELGRLIAVIPGKHSGNLMLAIHDNVFMAYSDKDGKKCLNMNVQLYKPAGKADKDKLVEQCTALFGRVCDTPPDCVYFNIIELDNWGVGGIFK